MVSILGLKNIRDARAIAAEIRPMRKQQKLSQVDLAAKVGISQPYLSKIENGDATEVPFDIIVAILYYLGTDVFIGKIDQK